MRWSVTPDATILVPLLDRLGSNVDYYVPDKWDSYGLSADGVDEIPDSRAELMITVDCGTTAHEEIARARSNGINVVVTDHHAPEDQLPDVVACINPRREDSRIPTRSWRAERSRSRSDRPSWNRERRFRSRRTPANE